MKRNLFVALLFFSVMYASSQERNFQIWNTNKLELKISERISVGVNEKINYLPKSGDVTMKFGELFVKRQNTEWFDIGISGRLLWRKNENMWIQEYRPMIFGNLSASLGLLEFDFSNRFEYRMYKYLNDHFRHRQMLAVEIPPFSNAKWLKMYLGEETFCRFDEARFHLARFHTGTKIKCQDSFEMKVYYILEKSKNALFWTTTDIVGLNLNLQF